MAAETRNGGLLERARLGLIALLLAGAACRRDEAKPAFAIPGENGPRIVVEVLNTTGRTGLARTATRVLRRAGIDVVSYGTAPADNGRSDSTRILVRRGSRSAGERVRRALQLGTVSLQPDSTRLVDVSVLLGADFAARAPFDFHP